MAEWKNHDHLGLGDRNKSYRARVESEEEEKFRCPGGQAEMKLGFYGS